LGRVDRVANLRLSHGVIQRGLEGAELLPVRDRGFADMNILVTEEM
jgi:hypothetical protein